MPRTLTTGVRRILVAAMLAALGGCQERNAPTSAPPLHPSATISDGAHSGNDDAFFLPPLVPDPSGSPGYGDPFQPGLPVQFLICSVATASDDCRSAGAQLVRTLDATASLTDEAYGAQWDTKSDNLDPALTYRIEVWIEDYRLAFADVDVVSSGSELRNVNTGDYIALLDGRTLPIRVRIEQGWRCTNDASCVSQVVTNTPPAGQTATVVVASDSENAASFPANWFDTSQVHTSQVIVTIEDVTQQLDLLDPSTGCGIGQTVMLTDGHCVRFTTDPRVTFTAPVRVQVCVENPNDLRQMLLKYDYKEPPEFLENVEALYPCPEPQRIGSTGGASTFERLASAVSRAGGALWRFIGPRPAYAIHLGVGGQISVGGSFSLIAPGLPVVMRYVAGDSQTAIAGSALPVAPQVRLVTPHPTDSVLAGAQVTCTVTSGGGSFGGATSANVASGTDGIATCPTWTLGATAGTNTVRITTAKADEVVRIGARDAAGRFIILEQPGALTMTAQGSAPAVVIDGVMSPGEWDGAATFTFDATLPGTAGTTPATLFVKNDAKYIYFAVRYARASDAVDLFGFEFDNNNDGQGPAVGDDYFNYSAFGFSDAYRSACDAGALCVTTDNTSGGTNDGVGAFQNAGGYSVYEIAHPLNSGDKYDFALSPGQTIGFHMGLYIGGAYTELPSRPLPSYLTYTVTR